ncbi:MAG: hypothetical protein WC413_03605 [Candidatus Nanoarchaeia archaeon]
MDISKLIKKANAFLERLTLLMSSDPYPDRTLSEEEIERKNIKPLSEEDSEYFSNTSEILAPLIKETRYLLKKQELEKALQLIISMKGHIQDLKRLGFKTDSLEKELMEFRLARAEMSKSFKKGS